jgi:hypothetical protein
MARRCAVCAPGRPPARCSPAGHVRLEGRGRAAYWMTDRDPGIRRQARQPRRRRRPRRERRPPSTGIGRRLTHLRGRRQPPGANRARHLRWAQVQGSEPSPDRADRGPLAEVAERGHLGVQPVAGRGGQAAGRGRVELCAAGLRPEERDRRGRQRRCGGAAVVAPPTVTAPPMAGALN